MKKTLIGILAIFAILLTGYAVLKTEFPDLQPPLINKYVGEVEPSQAGSPYKTYFYQLSSIEKQAYNLILEHIYEMPEKILVPNLTQTELDEVFKAILNDNPDLYFVGRKCTLKPELWNVFISFEYIMTPGEYESAKADFKERTDTIIASLSDPGDQFKTELEIHDIIVRSCSYKIEEDDYIYSSSYGCLINGKAACEGYSKAAKYLFDRVGIESALICGKATPLDGIPGDHMWNVVKINGDWYHLDCTWDDPVAKKNSNIRMYTYFNITDDKISSNHSEFSFDHSCIATAENYYVRMSMRFDNYDGSCETKLRTMLLEKYNSGEKSITVDFVNESSYNNAFSSLITDKRIFRVLDGVHSNSGTGLSRRMNGYIADDKFYTITFSFD